MKYVVIAMLALAACEDEAPETAEGLATKMECKAVLAHVAKITPQGERKDPEQVVAALPIEDIQGCGASEPEIRACMLVAPDVDGVKKCIPSDEVLACMRTATKAKHQDLRAKCWPGNAKADELTVVLACMQTAAAAKGNEVRAKCWAGDATAADRLTVD